MMEFRELLKQGTVYLDGGMGTLLQQRGLQAGELPERWNITHAEDVIDIQRRYFDAGSHVVCSNTFGANSLKYDDTELDAVIAAALDNAREARRRSVGAQPKFVALDIGPSGKLLAPLGDLDFEEAVAMFAKTVAAGVRHGAELIVIETMNDSYETKAALLAAKENSTLPVLVTNAYGADGKLMTGATPEAMAALLEGLGADAIGANCSLGPRQLRPIAEELVRVASVPVILKPNAGLPQLVDGQTVFDVPAAEFAAEAAALLDCGVRVLGGCCGTTPEYIAAVVAATKDKQPLPLQDKRRTVVASYTHAVAFGDDPLLIGERLNPTGKKRMKQALLDGDMSYLLAEGLRQQEAGAHILDVNVGLPELDEAAMLGRVVCELQAVTNLPLQIDTANPQAMEAALRRVNGKPLINSVTGKADSMAAVFPLAKKYGGVVVALTLDEQGIPATADERVAIASRIIDTAAQYGIAKENLVFDTLAMTASADSTAPSVTLDALRRIRHELGCHTSLGVSNVSFGLPSRDTVTATFFTMALQAGLSAAIMNPHSAAMQQAYHAYRALVGLDNSCAAYIEAATAWGNTVAVTTPTAAAGTLQEAIVKGLRDAAATLAEQRLQELPPLEVVAQEIIPALNTVGEGYENKTVYLPQLLMSAEAAQSAFEVIKARMSEGAGESVKGTVVVATVQGDIHDIGKNIAKLLLENYGFAVVDLGRDVPPTEVLRAVVERKAALVGLSALMTTTVPAMEETVRLLRRGAPWCRVMVGGAVLTPDYAERIGAHRFVRDAMEDVRYAEEVFGTAAAH